MNEKNIREAVLQGLKYLEDSVDPKRAWYKRSKCGHVSEYSVDGIRQANKSKRQVTCGKCVDNEIELILNAQKAEFIKREGDMTTFLKPCGHQHTCLTTLVRTRPITSCSFCRKESLIEQAKHRGLEPVDRENPKQKDFYKYIKCGHTAKVSLLAATAHVCEECKRCERVDFLNSVGVEVIDFRVVEGRKRFVGVFKNCGHERVFDPGQFDRLSASDVVCKICTDNKHKEEAEKHGLEMLGHADGFDSNYREYKMPCCGSTQEIEITHVRRGHFCCRSCHGTKYDKPTSVYLFHIKDEDDEWLKLGISIDPERRVKDYGLPETSIITELHTVQYPDGYIALSVEKELHRIFKEGRLCVESMRSKHTESGFTECYPVTLKDDILSELKEREQEEYLV